MLLEYSDVSQYFCGVEPQEVDLLISRVQSVIEIHIGRSLDVDKVVEQKQCPDNARIQFTHLPIIENSEETPITLEYRTSYNNQWQTIDTSHYNVDYDLGSIDLNWTALNQYRFVNYYDFNRNHLTPSRMTRNQFNKNFVRLSYYSGIDFTTATPGLQNIKNIFISIMKYFQNTYQSENIKRFNLEEQYEVEYFEAGKKQGVKGSELIDMLSAFDKYRIRTFIT